MDCFSVTNILHISQEEMEAPLQFSSIETGSYLQELLLSRGIANTSQEHRHLMGGETPDF